LDKEKSELDAVGVREFERLDFNPFLGVRKKFLFFLINSFCGLENGTDNDSEVDVDAFDDVTDIGWCVRCINSGQSCGSDILRIELTSFILGLSEMSPNPDLRSSLSF